MTPRLTLDSDRLARLRVPLAREARSLQPAIYRPDGLDVTVVLPGVDYLATLLSLDGLDAYRRGSTVVARHVDEDDQALDLLDAHALAEDLRSLLTGLPHRPDAGEAYLDLRLAASVDSPRLDRYLAHVVRSWRESLPAAPRPKARRRPSSEPTRTPAEVERDRRAAWRAEDEATVRHVIRRWHEAGALTPGRYLARDLFEKAASAVERSVAAGKTMPDGSPLSTAFGSRTFYRVADDVLGPRTRTKHGNTYTIEEDRMAPIFTRSEILAEVARQERETVARVEAASLLSGVEDFLRLTAESRSA